MTNDPCQESIIFLSRLTITMSVSPKLIITRHFLWNMESNLNYTIKYPWLSGYWFLDPFDFIIISLVAINQPHLKTLQAVSLLLGISANKFFTFSNPSVFNKYVNFIWCEDGHKSSSFRIMNLIVYIQT